VKPVVCAIGTTEPWSAAGLTLDVRALAELGAHPLTVVAAVSAQDGGGVGALFPLPPAALRAQLESIASAPIDAFRIGALPTLDSAREVVRALAARTVPSVYDPAFLASAGGALTRDDAAAIAWTLIPHVSLVTPNLDEAEVLLERPVRDLAQMHAAASELVARGAAAALVKGGHLEDRSVDVLCASDGSVALAAPRLEFHLRGTGCLLADAVAVALARGTPLRAAVESARGYVRAKLAGGITLAGMRLADGF
jgi:hydroxymethylpyrimidine/phosphomethylpyrimidine kinase